MMIIEIILMKMIGNIWLINYNYDEYNYNDDQDAVDRVLGPICLEPLTLTSLLCWCCSKDDTTWWYCLITLTLLSCPPVTRNFWSLSMAATWDHTIYRRKLFTDNMSALFLYVGHYRYCQYVHISNNCRFIIAIIIFSCPQQLNRWPCPLLAWSVRHH